MIWQLSEEYRVKVEPLNFVLQRLTEVTNRETKEARMDWKTVGYYSGLESAIRAIPDDIALSPEVEDYKGLRALLDALAGQLARRVGK